jgi:hypothetical protein
MSIFHPTICPFPGQEKGAPGNMTFCWSSCFWTWPILLLHALKLILVLADTALRSNIAPKTDGLNVSGYNLDGASERDRKLPTISWRDWVLSNSWTVMQSYISSTGLLCWGPSCNRTAGGPNFSNVDSEWQEGSSDATILLWYNKYNHLQHAVSAQAAESTASADESKPSCHEA